MKLTIAVFVLAALPTLAIAYCNETRLKPDGSFCPTDMVYNGEFALCVEKPTG